MARIAEEHAPPGAPETHSCWTRLPLRAGSDTFVRVGPLRLWLQASPGELTLALERGDDPLEPGVEGPCEGPPTPEGAERHRFAVLRDPAGVTLRPALPDRPVVVRPESPLHLPPGMEASLSVSLPTWFRLELDWLKAPLLDLPAWRPSDTWFGPSVRVGELCYASRSRALLAHPEGPPPPARARCRVRLRNLAEDELLVERICVPVPRLGLYRSGGALYAGSLDLVRQASGSQAEVSLHRGAPEGLVAPELLTPPRQPDHHNIFVRALGALLG